MKLGISPLSWMNSDLPALGSYIPLEQCLQEASSIGYTGIEMEAPLLQIFDHLPELLKKYNLVCTAWWHSTHLLENSIDEEIKKLDAHLDRLEKLGGKVVNLAECTGCIHQDRQAPLSKRPILKDLKPLLKKLDLLAKHIADRGFKSAYHPHMGTVIQNREEIDALMDQTTHLGLLFDTGHLLYAGEDPLLTLQDHVSRITHVHLKNVRVKKLHKAIEKDSPFLEAVLQGIFTVPGDTSDDIGLDFRQIAHIFSSNLYKGWIVIEAEQNPDQAHPHTYASMGYLFFKQRPNDDRYRCACSSIKAKRC